MGASHSGVPGNDGADELAAATHINQHATIFIDPSKEAGCTLHEAISLRPSDTGVNTGSSSPSVPKKLHQNARALLRRFRANCAFTRAALYQLGHISASNCVLCGALEDGEI